MVHHPVLYNPVHGLCEVYPGGIDGGGKTGVGTDTGVGIDFQDPRFPGIVHTEIDPSISPQTENPPAWEGNIFMGGKLFFIYLIKIYTPRGMIILIRICLPLGAIADDTRP